MLNQFVLVGRLETINTEENYIILKGTSSYKNSDGIYEEFTNKIMVFGELLKHANEYVKTNDIIGIKGSIQNNIIKADKITFLSSSKSRD